MTKQNPRVAILGFSLESNGFAPVARREEFEQSYLLAGRELEADIRSPHPRVTGTVNGFREGMDASGEWELVPVLIASTSSSGPVDQAFFDELLREMQQRLEASLPLDAVYISEHGAATATVDTDPDGTLFEMVRRVVGREVPVVATLDLHANVSSRMVAMTDLLVAFLTNPHVDQRERGREAAAALRELLAGMRTKKALVKVPLMPPSVTLLTGTGEDDRPYGDLIRYGQGRVGGTVLNISVCAGFFLTDSPKGGMSVVVTTRGDQEIADQLARELAQRAWDDRHRYVPRLVSIDEATRRMVETCRESRLPSLCIADVADNPGGGGRGNTSDLLQSFIAAGIERVALGVFNDAALASEAHRRGTGTRFRAMFNRMETHPMSKPFEADVKVVSLTDGRCVGRRGSNAGRTLALGPSARLRIGGDRGIEIVVISIRQQCTDPVMLESFGIDIASLRGLIVKSRGHFRAGFDEFFRGEQIVEVDAPGLTSPVLSRWSYRNVPRPVFPLDSNVRWRAQETA
jgi:microcystin degradation protein MlrC